MDDPTVDQGSDEVPNQTQPLSGSDSSGKESLDTVSSKKKPDTATPSHLHQTVDEADADGTGPPVRPTAGGVLSGRNRSGNVASDKATQHDSLDAVASPSNLESLADDFFESEASTIGRYQLLSRLGFGGFGSVFLANDSDLQRRVAIKIPHPNKLARPKDVERFLAEAQTVAGLDHPGIVPIYDYGRIDDRCYVVSKYIEGGTLSQRMRKSGVSQLETVQIIRHVADALAYIHESGITHRDIKPGNLLLDSSGACYVTDFGLALRDFSVIRKQGRIGTYCYMSPEQARGESHLVDGQSDLFSLGVVMYELLSGVLPFLGTNVETILSRICDDDPKPLRAHRHETPKELERICLKLLSKRAKSRHRNATELVEDLDCFLSSGVDVSAAKPSSSRSNHLSVASADRLTGIVPRGLRSFDQEDALFFRDLLPGMRDRDGLPDSIQYWRRRIESTDPIESFRVGVLYGSSGSGKSSFIKAGLIPVLKQSVTAIFVEATGTQTEDQLLSALRARCDGLPRDLSLVETFRWLRGDSDNQKPNKVLVILDQFEQWLHVHEEESNTHLVNAIRQCDGVNLQCLLLVRDDYWVGVSRLADELDVDLVRSRNMAMVDLFDKRHARKVLAEYGRGHDRLPENLAKLSSEQNLFLDNAIEGLAVEGKIIPVQLVTFAEIMKSRDWTIKSLHEIGGTDGVGVRFLEESLGASAPIENRVHSNAMQQLLKALLPDSGTNIKGGMRSEDSLRRIAGYQYRPRQFEQMIAILDTELRLITPTDSSGAEPVSPDFTDRLEADSEDAIAKTGAIDIDQRYFQLTHDFLVPAIRTWLERNQRLTLRGRAAMRLADRAQVWSSRRKSEHLPSWTEWLGFAALTKKTQRTDVELQLMNVATRRHSLRTLVGITAISLLGWFAYDFTGKSRTNALVNQLSTTSLSQAGGVLDQLDEFRRWSKPRILQVVATNEASDVPGLLSRIALLRCDPSHSEAFEQISTQLIESEMHRVGLICDELGEHPRLPELIERLWDVAENLEESQEHRLNASMALATFDPESERWPKITATLVDNLIDQTIALPEYYSTAVAGFSKSPLPLLDLLHRVFRDDESQLRRMRSSSFIIDFWRDDIDRLGNVLLDSDESLFQPFLSHLDGFPRESVEKVLADAVEIAPVRADDRKKRLRDSNRQANAAALLMRYAKPQRCWELLKSNPNPNTRSLIIERAPALGVNPRQLLEQYPRTNDHSIQSALLLMLGTIDANRFDESLRSRMLELAKKEFENSIYADVHSASHWLIQRYPDACGAWLEQTIKRLSSKDRPDSFGWTIDSFGQTLIRFVKAEHRLEVLSTEVTRRQYLDFQPVSIPKYALESPEMPVGLTDWFEAVEYCRWLTEKAGLSEEDQCHLPTREEQQKLRTHPDYKKRRGYRLLFPWEWETSCIGTEEVRFAMGEDEGLLKYYGNAQETEFFLDPVRTAKPVPTGIFGTYGGVHEWCSGYAGSDDEQPIRSAPVAEDVDRVEELSRNGAFVDSTNYFTLGFRICRIVPLKKAETSDAGDKDETSGK